MDNSNGFKGFGSGNQSASTDKLVELSSNLKILEDRYSNLRKKAQLTDSALIDMQREFANEKRLLGEEIMEVKSKLFELDEELDNMRAELKKAVKLKDFVVLDKYLEFWNPIDFLTRDEAEKLIDERLNK